MKLTVVWQKHKKITFKHYSNFLSYEQADKIGKQNCYGNTLVIGFSLPFHQRLQKAVKDIYAGIYYKYPLCCTLNFALDTLLNRPSNQLRYTDKTSYVPCCIHIRQHGKKEVPLDLY